MLKVDNIISMLRVVVPNMVSDSCSYLNLVMSIDFSSVEQRSCEPRLCSYSVTQVSNKVVSLEGVVIVKIRAKLGPREKESSR